MSKSKWSLVLIVLLLIAGYLTPHPYDYICYGVSYLIVGLFPLIGFCFGFGLGGTKPIIHHVIDPILLLGVWVLWPLTILYFIYLFMRDMD